MAVRVSLPHGHQKLEQAPPAPAPIPPLVPVGTPFDDSELREKIRLHEARLTRLELVTAKKAVILAFVVISV